MRWIRNRKTQIEGVWCVLGGFCFTIFVRSLENGSPDNSFRWSSDIWRSREWISNWDRALTYGHNLRIGQNVDHFLFGFFVTLILIWSIKVYKKLP